MTSRKNDDVYHIFAVSDSKGVTVEMVANVVAAQFRDSKTKVHKFSNVDSIQEIDEIIEKASQANAIIIHSFVRHELSDYIWYEGRLSNVEVVNLLGPILNRLSGILNKTPAEMPGLFSQLNKDYFRRMETTEFAIKHDDGAFPEELDKAEIILLGVSRTFKTPLSIYLAYKGWFVANVPVVLNMPLPEILYQLPADRIYCLMTNATSLSRLRIARNEYLQGLVPNYASFDYVKKELRYANYLFSTQPEWTTIKVTARPIEEIASNIIRIYRKKHKEKVGLDKPAAEEN